MHQETKLKLKASHSNQPRNCSAQVIERSDDNDDDESNMFIPERPKLPQLPVFCVSSLGHQNLTEYVDDQDTSTPFSDQDETGIPELQKYTVEKARLYHKQAEEDNLNELRRVLSSIDLWANSDDKGVAQQIEANLKRHATCVSKFTEVSRANSHACQ